MRKISKIILTASLLASGITTAQEFYTCVPKKDWWVDLVREATLKCPAGEYINNLKCEKCPTGTYSDKENSKGCGFCPAGTYADEKGSISCKNCPDGYFTISLSADKPNANTSLEKCIKCPYNGIQTLVNVEKNGCKVKCDFPGEYLSSSEKNCLRSCPDNEFIDNGYRCVKNCPSGKTASGKLCV